jgi:hypothetical protein
LLLQVPVRGYRQWRGFLLAPVENLLRDDKLDWLEPRCIFGGLRCAEELSIYRLNLPSGFAGCLNPM